MSKRESLQHALLREITVKNSNTNKSYRASVRQFCTFCKEHGVKTPKDAKSMIQPFSEALQESGYSPATIHTKLAAVCHVCHVDLGEIDKPKRKSNMIQRSRDIDRNVQGQLELKNEKYKRLVDFQTRVGIRRAELAALHWNDLRRDESGNICIRVKNGKGGKEQLQRILPPYINYVVSVMRDTCPDRDTVFSKEEMQNHIDLHGMRRHMAQEAYNYYSRRMTRDEKQKLIYELLRRYKRYHGNDHTAAVNWLKKALKGGKYVLRGANREKAECQNKPVVYDRLALMCVSVFHLSHWRLDVTVTNYMI